MMIIMMMMMMTIMIIKTMPNFLSLSKVRRQQPQPNNNNNNNNYQPPSEHRPPLYDFNISKYDPNFNDELEDVVLDDDEYDNPLDVQSQVYNLFTELYMDLTK